ncbi:hypothetical protein EVG20_g4427 [Dentipellis fragilis]|uniref:FYVE-type domain-containing protein n=1 Tax=Dentipellis fragilis TaxID=205917 RepID=A0A4Y9YWS2_9AGAM|nr:hypothetical protein EVG20_g4427 [Dentipellis fragilis]
MDTRRPGLSLSSPLSSLSCSLYYHLRTSSVKLHNSSLQSFKRSFVVFLPGHLRLAATVMESLPPPVPYQAYRSKRHSRNFSNQTLPPSTTPSPLPPSSPTSITAVHEPLPSSARPEASRAETDYRPMDKTRRRSSLGREPPVLEISTKSVPASEPNRNSSPPNSATPTNGSNGTIQPTIAATLHPRPASSASTSIRPVDTSRRASDIPSSSSASTPTTSRRTSTFRHIPPRHPSAAATPSTLRSSTGSFVRDSPVSARQFDQVPTPRETIRPTPVKPIAHTSSHGTQISTTSTLGSDSHTHTPVHRHDTSRTHSPHVSSDLPHPSVRTTSLQHSLHPSTKSPSPVPLSGTPTPIGSASPASTPSRSHTPIRTSAPYRPGFQPKGVYRPRTDEFLDARREFRDVGRVERTRLERRLEKLIHLHFGSESEKKAVERPRQSKRMSSLFDFDIKELRNMDAGDLWRGVVQSQITPGSKADIRAAEQHVTPWQEDATVSACPLCTASFHSITNRKHHCRLCGRIICALPPKHPQRPATCSLLFVVDPKSGRIEEVGEGVDYGVRKRGSPTVNGRGKEKEELGEEDKFLKGVRICRDCRPILLHQQYIHENAGASTFARLYDVFISLEKEIEDSLPLFQELLLTLSHDDQPTPEASAARKRLLEAFAQYDALAKRIRKLPTSGAGSSQDRVQAAVLSRANAFLQKNMFPLQSLPKPKKATSSPVPRQEAQAVDPDSEVAHALQPLLEQEALLESFINEAKAHRKFEDVKTLKSSLRDIQVEIDRIMANSQNGGLPVNGKGQSK